MKNIRLEELENEHRQLRIALKKYKKGRKHAYSLTSFKQPIMFLIRRNKDIEFFECDDKAPISLGITEIQRGSGLSRGKFNFRHSDGSNRAIDLKESYLYTFPYGNTSFKGYILHEDWAHPLMPETPLVEYKNWKNSINNAMSADLKWKAEEKKANAKFIWAIFGGLALIGAIYVLYTMLKPAPPPSNLINLANQTIQIIPK